MDPQDPGLAPKKTARNSPSTVAAAPGLPISSEHEQHLARRHLRLHFEALDAKYDLTAVWDRWRRQPAEERQAAAAAATAWLREREATREAARRARDAQYVSLLSDWREHLDGLADQQLAEDTPAEVVRTLEAFTEQELEDRAADAVDGERVYHEDGVLVGYDADNEDWETVGRAELHREINTEKFRRRDVRWRELAARRAALSAHRAPLRVSRRRESHRTRPGHRRRVRASESPPGEDPPAAPPRLTLAPEPGAIGCLFSAEARGATIEAVA